MVLMWKIVVKLQLYIIKSLFVYVTSQDEHTCDFNEDLFAMLDVLTPKLLLEDKHININKL